MPQFLVAINGGNPVPREVQSRTRYIQGGVLCEVQLDGRPRLCLVERVVNDAEIAVRPLPEPPEIAPR
jgi:hypothetical protein